MKKLNVILLTVVASVLMLTSCSPYEEGPAISLRSRTERLCNEWRLTRLYINGTEQTLSSFDQQTTLEFKDNGTVNYSYAIMDSTAIVITGSGTWEFNDDQTEVITKITYTIGGTVTDTFKILRLKEEELWLENNQDGDVEETHYEPK